MAEAKTGDKQDSIALENDTKSYLHDEDLALFDHHFYWQYDDLFVRIKNEMAAVERCLEHLQIDKDHCDKDVLNALQQRLDRLKKIQIILNDRSLDDFKEIIYPMAKFVPALALFGAGGLSIVIGPVFACLFAVAFLTSNLYLKGKKSKLNIHFGIASTIQTTAVILAVLSISGLLVVNPGVIAGLVAVGGTWLFCAAVFRGGERQKEARDVKLSAIDKNMQSFYNQLQDTQQKIRSWSMSALASEKDYTRMDVLIDRQLSQSMLSINAKSLEDRFNISEKDAEIIMIDIQKLKLFYDGYAYYCQDYENLLRTVKNPFEKSNRVSDLKKIQSHANQLQSTCTRFTACANRINQKAEDTKENITFVMRRDMPWILTNIPLIILTALTLPLIGGAVLGAPLLLSPYGLMIVGGVACVVALISLCFYGLEKYRSHKRTVRDAETQKRNELLDLHLGQSKSPSVSETLRRKSKKVPMLISPKEAEKYIHKIDKPPEVGVKNTTEEQKNRNKDQKA